MDTTNCNKKQNRKRRLELDDCINELEPPTKKRRLENTNNSNKNDEQRHYTETNSIVWKNEMVLHHSCIGKLNQIISQHISTYQYGFGIIDNSLFESVINKNMNNLRTMNGLLLKDIPNIILLLKGLRAVTIMNKQLNCPHIIPSVLKTNDFRLNFDINNDNKLYNESDQIKWLNICNLNGIPPYMLLTNWLKKNNVFRKNKQINKMVITTESYSNWRFKILNNKSFRKFCLIISKNDSCCFQYEAQRKKRATQFEELMYDKLKRLISENKIDVKMRTEEEQISDKNRETNLTPDILFTDHIIINNQKIYWIDMKNFFIKKGFLWNKVNKSIAKYTKAFGNGAIICRGFEHSLKRSANCLLLDAFCDRK